MQRLALLTWAMLAARVGVGSGQSQPAVGTAAWTNAVRAKSIEAQMALVSAGQAAENSAAATATDETSARGTSAGPVRTIISPSAAGAVADLGRFKVEFPLEVTRVIRIVAPDGQVLECQAMGVVLYSPSTDQSYVLGTLTNSLGVIVAPNAVVYSNAFDGLPGAHLRYECDPVRGALSQFVALETWPEFPAGFSAPDTAIEVWSWWSAAAVSTESRRIQLRQEGAGVAGVEASDVCVDFGTMKIVGDGKAFSLGNPLDTVPVAKAWNNGVSEGGSILIESVDWQSLASKVGDLPKATRPKSASSTRPNRSKLLAGLSSARRGMPAVQPPQDAATVRLTASAIPVRSPMAVARSPRLPAHAAVIDFTLMASTPVPAGAISWWPAGGDGWDAIGGNHGYLTNGASYAAGEIGQGFSFDGVDDFVAVPWSSALDATKELTIEFWMRPEADNAMEGYQGLVSTPYYAIEIGNGYQSRMGVNFVVSTDGGSSWAMTSEGTNGGGAVVSAGEWHHVAGTYDGQRMRLYIDGAAWGVPVAQTGTIAPAPPGTFLALGSEDGRGEAECIGARYFKGRIDEAAIYGRALSAAEILAIYNAGGAGKRLPKVGAEAVSLNGRSVGAGKRDLDGAGDAGAGSATERGKRSYQALSGLSSQQGLQVFTPLK